MKVMVMIGVKNGCRGECDGDGDVNLVWRGWRGYTLFIMPCSSVLHVFRVPHRTACCQRFSAQQFVGTPSQSDSQNIS